MAPVDLRRPAVQRFILALLAGGSLLGLFFFSRVLPFGFPVQSEKIEALKSDYDRKSTELARARATVADLPRFEAEYAHLHERWAQAAELVPTERQLPTLMRRIALAAQQNGVGFTSFRPAEPHAEQHYTETPMQLAVYGNFHQIGAFLADLANLRRIVTVAGVQLKANTKDEMDGTTTAEFRASAYHLTTGAITPEAPPAARKEEERHERKQS